MLEEIFIRHEKVALMYSGGRDSIACLELVRPWLDKVHLVSVNTGAAFPEIEEHMEEVRASGPHFHEIRTQQPLNIATVGHPVDVLPINNTLLGQACTEPKPIKLQSYLDCCSANFMAPADQAARELGVTAVIRGQRADEMHRAPVSSGHVWNGIEYIFPIEDWSSAQVVEFIAGRGYDVSDRLSMEHSSLDCWNCTAFCKQSRDRFDYLKRHHPGKHREVVRLLGLVREAIASEMTDLEEMANDRTV